MDDNVSGGDGAGRSATTDAPIFEALLVPYRSLGRGGFNFLMAVVAVLSVAVSVGFLVQGAWPVVGFFGLDVLLLWIAFRASYRAARAREEVSVSRSNLAIRKVSPAGAVSERNYNPLWARFRVSRHAEIGITRMVVAGEGRRTEIGGFLNPEDRESFAAAFARALSSVGGR